MRKTWILSFLFLASTALAQPVPTIRPNPYAMNCVIPGCAWSSSTTYNVNDTVLDGGILYIAIAPHSNHEPPNGTYWAQLSASGGSMSWPGAGIAVSSGSSAWSASLTAPTGTIVGTTDSQQLSNKTFGTGMTWPTFNQSTSGTAASLSAILANTLGGTGIDSHALSGVAHVTSGTWTASAVVDANVSFTTPALGSPTGTNYTVNDGGSLVFGTSSGGKIGTSTLQKLAFYNSTPIAKPSGSALTALSNLGLVTTPTIAATDLSSAQVALARGGTNADTSATGPGYWRQKTAGAAVTVGSTFVDASLYITPGTNCTSALQALITNTGSGATIVLPAGDIQLSDTITIGNGSNGVASTIQNIKIVGQATSAGGWWNGAGNTGNTATTLRWIGSTGKPMLRILGPIGGLVLENIYLDGGVTPGADNLIWATHMQSSEWHNVQGRRWGVAAYVIDSWLAGNPPQNNTFLNIGCDHPWGTAADGLVLGAATASVSSGVSGYGFFNCCFQAYFGGTGYSCRLRFCDSHVFINCYFAGGTGHGIGIQAPSDENSFPMDITFFGSPGNVEVITTTPTWAPPRNQSIQFFPFYTDDGESFPIVQGIGGITDNGMAFGQWMLSNPQLGAATAGNLTLTALVTPAPVYVSQAGTAGLTTYTYAWVATLADGSHGANASATTTTGNANLTSVNYNFTTCTNVPGATSYDVYRTVGGATQGKLNTSPILGTSSSSRVLFSDTGITGDASTPPTTNTTGVLTAPNGNPGLSTVVTVGACTETFSAGILTATTCSHT